MEQERIEIGWVHSVNPARRELRVTAVPAYEYQLKDLKWIRLAPPGGAEARLRVASVKLVAGGAIVALVPGVLRETVARMKAATVTLLPEELKPRPLDDYTMADLLDFEVIGPAGESMGRVIDIYPTPAHDVLNIETADGKSILVPAIEEVIAAIEWERERLVVHDLTPYSVEDED